MTPRAFSSFSNFFINFSYTTTPITPANMISYMMASGFLMALYNELKLNRNAYFYHYHTFHEDTLFR